MNTKLYIIFLGLMISTGIQAQVNRSFGIHWGAGAIKKQDLIFSPMIYNQFSPYKVKLNYSHSGKVEQELDIQFSTYSASLTEQFEYFWHEPTDLIESGQHSFTMLYINYKLGGKIVDNEKFSLKAGVRLRSRLNVATYTYGIYWLGHFGYYFSHGLDAYADLKYNFSEKHAVKMGVALPMFSLVSRSPYMAQNAEYFNDNISHSSFIALFRFLGKSTPQSWGSSQIADFNLGYKYTVSDKLDIDLSYLFSMDMNNTPKQLTQFENSIFIGATLKF